MMLQYNFYWWFLSAVAKWKEWWATTVNSLVKVHYFLFRLASDMTPWYDTTVWSLTKKRPSTNNGENKIIIGVLFPRFRLSEDSISRFISRNMLTCLNWNLSFARSEKNKTVVFSNQRLPGKYCSKQ